MSEANHPPPAKRKSKPLPTPIEVAITSWSADFEGEASFQKPSSPPLAPPRKVIVPCSMPGDVLEVIPQPVRRGVCRGSLEKIITPSSERIPARCPHFGVCGGCRLQHVLPAQQVQLKQEKVTHLIVPLGDLSTLHLPIQAAENVWEYRNKMEFSFSSNAKGERYLGLIGLQGKGRAINLDVCYLVRPWMAELLKVVRQWWEKHSLTSYHPYRNVGSLRTLTLREGFASGDRLVMLTVSGNPEDALSHEAISDWVKLMQGFCCQDKPDATLSCFVRIQQANKGSPTQFYEMLLSGPGVVREELVVQAQTETPPQTLKFEIGPTSFFQPNPKQAERLYSLALQMASLTKQTTLYDLCCGTATLGIAAARFVRNVVGVELSPEALLDAKMNCTLNECTNVVLHKGDVAVVVARLASEEAEKEVKEEGTRRVVIVDPPRAGLVEAAHRAILALLPEQILSISCNPVTQARDIKSWVAAGYRLVKVQPVECFPHTPHIENIALLERVVE